MAPLKLDGRYVSLSDFQKDTVDRNCRPSPCDVIASCVVDLKQPGVKLSAVFDPVLITELNKPSEVVTGQAKYPALLVSQTRERFGLQYVEPGCHPVPLDWDKHKSQKAPVAGDGKHQSLLSVRDSHLMTHLRR
ncbi:hypothetical protein QQF64_023628 [Cirrhinus molitorella]|uniref:Uncharacterized protein n=1 Tax=Cirrhinus molitorella TaxID=172907 RepID=A0ABR3NK42_9TELE